MTEYIKRENAILSTLGLTMLKNLPAAYVAEMRHGCWSWCAEGLYRCTACNTKTIVDECMEEPMYKYYPYYGALMEEGNYE